MSEDEAADPRADGHGDQDRMERVPVRSGEGGAHRLFRLLVRFAGHDRVLSIGAATRASTRPGRLGPERSLTLSESVLEEYGFEPDRQAPTEVRLLNRPFHPLAARSRELVCGINHAFLGGFLTGLQTTGIDAVLAPQPGRCCVELRAAAGGAKLPGPAGACAKEVCVGSAEDPGT